jgi:glycosyltransferase involved in cell wall biosynthesis
MTIQGVPTQAKPSMEPERSASGVEVSFVMPCLNEARTVVNCIKAARRCIDDNALRAEVIVADNGSTDGSQDLARQAGARVIDIKDKGYGHALMGGIAAAKGRFIVMGDSDESYDFNEAMSMITRLREGFDLVMGCRLPAGGGRIMPGAMPPLHRYLGNPVLSRIGRVVFRIPITDFHCGLRAFSRDAYDQMHVTATGMEFASELVIKAKLRDMRLTEVPITLHKDKRGRPPHLRSWRDGWRSLRFMLCLSPRWTLFIPGAALALLGLILGVLVARGPVHLGHVRLDARTLIAAALMLLVGYQAMIAGAAVRIYTLTEQIGPPSPALQRLFHLFTLERGVIAGLLMIIAGLAFIAVPLLTWFRVDLGDLPESTLRPMIVGSTLLALGVETVLMSFVLSMMAMERKRG